MKKIFCCIVIFCLIGLTINAQIFQQEGYVKTLGRPEAKGVALCDVTIKIKGEHNPVKSNGDGVFTIQFQNKKNGDAYALQEVRKVGFELNEPEVVGRQFAVSDKVRNTIVMVSTAQLHADKQRIENNAYKVAEKNYKQKLALLEKEKEDGAISVEKYREQLQELQNRFEKYQSLIDGLAEHYAHTDYDELNEKEQEINICIENGYLERADSLIQLLFDPIDVLKRNNEALANLNERILQAEGIVDQANKEMVAILKQQEKDAEHLYQLYTIALARFDNEKAGKYIEIRAELDTTNVKWQLDASDYFHIYVANYSKANHYGRKALYHSLRQYGETYSITAECFNNLGAIFNSMSKYHEAIEMYEKALSIGKIADGDSLVSIAKYSNNLGMAYLEIGDYPEALANSMVALAMLRLHGANQFALATILNNIAKIFYTKDDVENAIKTHAQALKIWESYYHENHPNIASMYDNIGCDLNQAGNFSKALEYHNKALNIRQKILSQNHPHIAINYENIASVYMNMEDYDKALEYQLKALEIFNNSLRQYDMEFATIYNNIGMTYSNQKRYNKALDYYAKALSVFEHNGNMNHYKVSPLYSNIASIYQEKGDSKNAIKYMEKALEVYEAQTIKDSLALAIIYNNYGMIYTKMKKYKKATDFYHQALNIFIIKNGGNHPSVASCSNNIAHLLVRQGNYSEALLYFEYALNIRLKKYPISHPLIISLKNNIKDVESILLKR